MLFSTFTSTKGFSCCYKQFRRVILMQPTTQRIGIAGFSSVDYIGIMLYSNKQKNRNISYIIFFFCFFFFFCFCLFCLYWVFFFIKTLLFKSSLRFTAQLRKRQRFFIYLLFPVSTHVQTLLLLISSTRVGHLLQLINIKLTHHNHSKSIVYITVHSWCFTFSGFGQMYNDMYPSLCHISFLYIYSLRCRILLQQGGGWGVNPISWMSSLRL